jgi:hypothetical protein
MNKKYIVVLLLVAVLLIGVGFSIVKAQTSATTKERSYTVTFENFADTMATLVYDYYKYSAKVKDSFDTPTIKNLVESLLQKRPQPAPSSDHLKSNNYLVSTTTTKPIEGDVIVTHWCCNQILVHGFWKCDGGPFFACTSWN